MIQSTILITGGAGYIGSHMLLALKELSYQVVVVDNLSTGRAQNIVYGEFVQGDLRDPDFVKSLFQRYNFQSVMHFAASVSVPESIAKPQDYFENNSMVTLNLVQACIRSKVKHFVLSSTAAVYGQHDTGIVDETTPLAPMNPYGLSKMMAEKFVTECFKDCDISYVILRYFNVAGVDDSLSVGPSVHKANHLLKAVVNTALKKQSHCEIFGNNYQTPDGTGVRDFIHVSDIVDAHLLALQSMKQRPLKEIYNCSYGQGISVLEVIEHAKKLFNTSIPVKHMPRREGDCPKMIANPAKLTQALDWRPKYNDLNLMLQSLMDWERSIETHKTFDL